MRFNIFLTIALLQLSAVTAAFSASIDRMDSLTVRAILNEVGWQKVPVDSVIDNAIRITAGNSTRVTALNLNYRSGCPKISQLPAAIGKLPELQSLSLVENALSSLPEEITSLHKVSWLNITSNAFTVIPEQIFRVPSLQVLNVGSNHIKSLPPSIGKLANLVILNSDHNQIMTVPAQIQLLTSLKNLSLIGNQIDTLPAEIAKIVNLEILRLDTNLLTTLPVQMTSMIKIRINISANRLCALSDQSLISWLNQHHMSPEWRASQQCAYPGYSAIATDAQSGTVVSFSSLYNPVSADNLSLSIVSYTEGGVAPLLAGKDILKMVKITIDPEFSGRVNTLLISFSFADTTLSKIDPSQISIYSYDGRQYSYLGGSPDLNRKTIAVQTSKGGIFALVARNEKSVAIKTTDVMTAPCTLTLSGMTLRLTFAHPRDATLHISLLTLNGKTAARTSTAGRHGATVPIPRELSGKPCIVVVDDGVHRFTRLISPL
jgi:hypothetical protein